jgi:multiple sugar transport system permease protein
MSASFSFRRRLGALARHGFLLVTGAFALLPFIWMVSLSLKPPDEIFQPEFRLWPSSFYGLENYGAALTAVPMLRFLFNGLFVCALIFALQLLVCVPCAYALAKLRFHGRDTLILPWIISAFGIFLLRQFFRSIPDELIHAARLDGLGEFEIIWRIMMPMSVPALAAFGIFSVVAHWNDLFWPLIAVRSEDISTPALGILLFRDDEAGQFLGPLMAGAVIIVAPLLIAFLIAQRRFIDGLATSALK